MFGLAFRKNLLPACRRWQCFQKYSTTAAAPRDKYKADHDILGYSVKQVEEISELNLTAVLLEHSATGAEHLHLASDDSNNLFGVSFRTPPHDHTGVPHILEHLTLCGSKRYPCRDPFMNMLNRSLSTFMNAFTGSDITIYAFSTQNSKDFQNLLSVYLDATFFPMLNEKDFRQEGWRLEHEDINNRDSPIVFKGVVFNEMKGVFSDSSQYYARHLQNYLFPCNTYSYESGGDPLHIPHLTWEGLKQFHAFLYHPSNSRFITYGNMPLEKHLERIETHVLQHFNKIKIENSVPDVKLWTKPRETVILGRPDPMAAIPEKQTILSNSYVLNNITDTYENFALSILGTLLVDGPNAPFYQKLLESGIGPDYSPYTGFDSRTKQSVFSVGLREISENDIEKVMDIIATTFDGIINTGFPEQQIKGVLHNVELATKHRTSNFGLNCALGVSSLWNHDGNPISAFKVNEHVQWFLKQLKENPHFLQDKIVQYFKNNNHRLTLIMNPSENFEARQLEEEKKLLESKLVNLTDTDRLNIYHQGLELAKHQQQNDTTCLPTLRMDDVKKSIEKTPLQFVSVENVPVQLCEQPTNEVVYFKALVDASCVPKEDTMLLPLFCSVITQMGAGSRNYKEFDQEVQLKTGGLNVSVHLSEHPVKPENFHQGILFSSYCLEKNASDMFSLWKDIFKQVHLEDCNRLSQLIKMNAAELGQSIAHQGHIYSMRRACSSLSACSRMMEDTAGLTQIAYMKELAEKDDHRDIQERLKKLADILFNQTTIKCALNATPTGMPSALNTLKTFLHDIHLSKNITSRKPVQIFQEAKDEKTHFILPYPINYLGKSIPTGVLYTHPDFTSLKIAARLMSTKFLHREIREKGGAYGGGAKISSGGHFMFYSYRDPNSSKTLQSFSSGIDWLSEASFSEEDIDEAKLGVLGEVDAPVTPGSKGSLFFLQEISDEMKQEMRQRIFDCKREDLISVAQKYLKDSQHTGTALIGPENELTKEWIIISNKL